MTKVIIIYSFTFIILFYVIFVDVNFIIKKLIIIVINVLTYKNGKTV